MHTNFTLQLALQAVCDDRSAFTHYDLGWPGSATDAKIYRESDIFIKRHQLFEDGEFILADKGMYITVFNLFINLISYIRLSFVSLLHSAFCGL